MDPREQKIINLIDRNRSRIIYFARDIYQHAELGFREYRTSEKFAEWMEALGLPVKKELALTGCLAAVNEQKKPVFHLALLGEMDALPIPDHCYTWKETMAAHCCGHHAQLAGVAGAALALADPDIRASLDGMVSFIAVPAEEYGEMEYRLSLQAAGRIRCGAGKPELIAEGVFDDIDLSVVHHLDLNAPFIGNGSSNGFVSKLIRIRGRGTHAAVEPEHGINALSAASLGLQALGMVRETFRDEDRVRVHPIMTRGGEVVNVTPSEAVLETYVRAKTIAAMRDAAEKTDRCFLAGAMAVGAGAKIRTIPGYLPGIPMPAYPELVEAMQLVEPDQVVRVQPMDHHDAGSSDLGDLQHFRPVVQFRTGGIAGGMHRSDFTVVDEEEAYIRTAKMFALIAFRILRDGAVLGRQIAEEHRPVFSTREKYLEHMGQFNSEIVRDYKEI